MTPKRVWRHEPDLAPSKDLAYIAGFYLGDGRSAGHEHKVRFNLADRRQLELVSDLTARIMGVTPKRCSFDGLFYSVDYDSVVLDDYLNQPLTKMLKDLKGFELDFLQGFFDAEGYASCAVDLRRGLITHMMVGAANTKLGYLSRVAEILSEVGIVSRINRTNRAGGTMEIRGKMWTRRHDVYHISLSGGEMIRRFQGEVGFRNPAKADRLASLVRMSVMSPRDRFLWFMKGHVRKGRRWVRA